MLWTCLTQANDISEEKIFYPGRSPLKEKGLGCSSAKPGWAEAYQGPAQTQIMRNFLARARSTPNIWARARPFM